MPSNRRDDKKNHSMFCSFAKMIGSIVDDDFFSVPTITLRREV
jgi:hypothetical protein